MSELLEAISAVIASVAGLASTVLMVLKHRAERANEKTLAAEGQRMHPALAKPIAVVLLGLTLVAVGVLLLSEVKEPDDAVRDRKTEVRLLRELVSERARRCQEAAPREPAVAAISCRLPPPMSRLTMHVFESDPTRVVEQEQKRLHLPRGSCETKELAWEPWKLGILLCDYGNGQLPAHLQWSRTDSNVVVEAEGRGGASAGEIYDWWLSESNGLPSNNRVGYPDRYEEYILRRTGLPRSSCRRRQRPWRKSAATVVCTWREIDHLFIAYYKNRGQLRAAFLTNPPPGTCHRRRATPTRGTYLLRGDVAGRRRCVVAAGRAVVEWINYDSRLYGFARVAGARWRHLERVFGWWRRDGRFLTD